MTPTNNSHRRPSDRPPGGGHHRGSYRQRPPAQGSRNMSSWRDRTYATSHNDRTRDNRHNNPSNTLTFTPTFASFKFTIPNTTPTVDRKLEVLEDLSLQNLEDWLCRYREAKTMCKWEDEEASTIFKALIHTRLHHIIEGKRTVDSMVEELLSTAYPEANFYVYLDELKEIRQEDFTRIRDYYEKIKSHVTRIGLCKR